MRTIQIDMFEVQLGAGLLLQFRTPPGRVVRILADAGVGTARNYPADHVHKKLNAAFADFGDSSRRIDLMVGTHYDADHLKGLVPIIEDDTIEITEAWLPPVANDEQRPLSSGPPRSEDFLAHQLRDELGNARLSAYLANKLAGASVLGRLDRLAENPYNLTRNIVIFHSRMTPNSTGSINLRGTATRPSGDLPMPRDTQTTMSLSPIYSPLRLHRCFIGSLWPSGFCCSSLPGYSTFLLSTK